MMEMLDKIVAIFKDLLATIEAMVADIKTAAADVMPWEK